jgi:hypothetical protein
MFKLSDIGRKTILLVYFLVGLIAVIALKQSHKIILIFWHESLEFVSCALLN